MAETGFICIARNIEGCPMEDTRWNEFVIDVLHLLEKCGASPIDHAYGLRIRDDETCETFIVGFSTTGAGAIPDELAFLAYLYEQTGIELTIGRLMVVTP